MIQRTGKKHMSDFAAPILIGLMVLAGAVSYFGLSSQSLRLDESQNLWQSLHSTKALINIVAKDVHVPLYHLLLHYWSGFLGTEVTTDRALSLIFFLGSIPAIYFLGRKAFSASAGLIAAALLALSPFMNWYGSEMRMYSMLAFVTILNQYFFVGLWSEPDGARRRAWAGYVLTALVGAYTHYFFLFVLAAQALFYFFQPSQFPRKSLRWFVLAALGVTAALAPWFVYRQSLGTEATNSNPLLTVPTSVDLTNVFSQFLFGFQTDPVNTMLVSLWPLLMLAGFLALREHKRVTPEAQYLLVGLFAPVAAAFLVSVFVTPLFLSRYLIMCAPSFYLLLGWLLSVYPRRLRKVLVCLAVLVMAVCTAAEIWNPSNPAREDYRGAAEYLNANAGPADVIVLSAPFTVYPVEYYYQGPDEIDTLPPWDRAKIGPIPPYDPAAMPDWVNRIIDGHANVWVLLSYDQGYEKDVRAYFEGHFQRLVEKKFSDDLTLYEYKVSYEPSVLGQ